MLIKGWTEWKIARLSHIHVSLICHPYIWPCRSLNSRSKSSMPAQSDWQAIISAGWGARNNKWPRRRTTDCEPHHQSAERRTWCDKEQLSHKRLGSSPSPHGWRRSSHLLWPQMTADWSHSNRRWSMRQRLCPHTGKEEQATLIANIPQSIFPYY